MVRVRVRAACRAGGQLAQRRGGRVDGVSALALLTVAQPIGLSSE